MDSADILFIEKNSIGFIMLNRTQALNALTLSMVKALYDKLLEWEADSSVYAIVIHSASPVAFCAGGDVRTLYSLRNQRLQQLAFFKAEYQLNLLISQLTTPYIPILNGITFGGGIGISLHSRYVIASEKTSFALPEASIGLFPDVGSSYLLNQCPDFLGYYLGLTGNRFNADDARALNLIWKRISSTQIASMMTKLMSSKWCSSQEIIDYLNTLDQPTTKSLNFNFDEINCFFSRPTINSLLADLEQSNKSWAHEVYHRLSEQSPLSLDVTLRLLKKTAGHSLKQCLELDYQLVQFIIEQGDFYEGVRAQLIDKDKKPVWEHYDENKLPDHIKSILSVDSV